MRLVERESCIYLGYREGRKEGRKEGKEGGRRKRGRDGGPWKGIA